MSAASDEKPKARLGNAIKMINTFEQQRDALQLRVEQQEKVIRLYDSSGFADADAVAEAYLELKAELEQVRELGPRIRSSRLTC